MAETRLMKDLKIALNEPRDWLAVRHGRYAIENLKPGVDPKVVKKVFQKTLPQGWGVRTCRRLPEEYVPAALAALSKGKNAQALFVVEARRDGEAPSDFLRRVAAWTFELTRDAPKTTAQLEKLTADPRDVAAAQTTVAKFGLEAEWLLSVLAWDGSETSADILLALANDAMSGNTKTLEVLQQFVVPYARGPRLKPMLDALQKTNEQRPEAEEIAALLERLGLPQQPLQFSFKLESGDQYRSVVLGCFLNSREHPSVTVWVYRKKARGNEEFHIEDGKVLQHSLKVPKLKSLEALPAWLVTVAKTLHIRWRDPATVKCSLKGPAKKRLLEWVG